MAETPIDIYLANMKCSMSNLWLSTDEKSQIKSLFDELGVLRSFLNDSHGRQYDQNSKVKDLVAQILDLAHESVDAIDSLVVANKRPWRRAAKRVAPVFYPYYRILRNIRREIKVISKAVKKISDNRLNGIGASQFGIPSHQISFSSRSAVQIVDEETVVGFVDEVEALKERLTGMPKQLQVVSVVGMAGLGKTTLARKLYNDPFIVYHFYVRGWTSVSQVYQKRDLLLGILSSIVEHKDDIWMMSDEKLGEELHNRLKSRRYLIVLDDIWNIEAWNELKLFFPNDYNGSRVLFTSRLTDVALGAKPASSPHFLRFLNLDESWDLLRQKVFQEDGCPTELIEIGKKIVGKCRGLPLAIVVIAGLLAKTEHTDNWWKEVAESIGPYIVTDPEQCMETLALSYNHLPQHLKLCFLYLGSFPEDYEISVTKLFWLWIAEGFVQSNESKRLEDVAEEYLLDLIDRSLVLVDKRRSTGGIRACRVHDLLRDMCLMKSKEQIFLQQIYKSSQVFSPRPTKCIDIGLGIPSCFSNSLSALGPMMAGEEQCDQHENDRPGEDNSAQHEVYGYEKVFPSCSSSISTANKHQGAFAYFRLSNYIFPRASKLRIRSFLSFASNLQTPLTCSYLSFYIEEFKLVRVLDLSSLILTIFPREIRDLILLRYLAIRGKSLHLPLYTLLPDDLETIILLDSRGSTICSSFWRLPKLRHLCIAGENEVDSKELGLFGLPNLQTISAISPSSGSAKLLHRTPNLRKLGFCGNFITEGRFRFPYISPLNHLESLKFLNRTSDGYPQNGCGYSLQERQLPASLKRLTLSLTYLDWKEMSVLGMLPNLESLKLEYQACIGPVWVTSNGGFYKLKYLKLYYVNMSEWHACGSNFPSLQRLVMHNCEKLLEIPAELGDIHTLQTIEVSWCSHSAAASAWKILRQQRCNGNDYLNVFVNPPVDEPEEHSSIFADEINEFRQ